jgi:hypothetical protein
MAEPGATLSSRPEMIVRFLYYLSMILIVFAGLTSGSTTVRAQSSAMLHGRIVDPKGAVISGARITARNGAASIERFGETDDRGIYQIAALPVGSYRVEVRARGFKTKIVERLDLQVGRIIVQDFDLIANGSAGRDL